MPFLNPRRLRDYPRLIGIVLWAVWELEVLLHHGWRSGLGPILGSDFITLYGAGLLYRWSPERLYDFRAQAQIQAALITPTPYPGLNPFISPPYVAMAYGLLTALPLALAYALWSSLTLGWVLHATWGLRRFLPEAVRAAGLSFPQMVILILLFFPFLAGWRLGQNHGLTLWLITGILLAQRAGRPGLAGLLAGLLLYKPQFVLGFLILWAAWKEVRALTAFGAVAVLWLGLSLWTGSAAPYGAYLAQDRLLLPLPWVEGLFATLLPPAAQPTLRVGSLIALLLLGSGLAFAARPLGGRPFQAQAPAWMLALLYPILALPYALIHDLILLIPILTLWAAVRPTRRLLYTAVAVYLGALILPFLGALLHLALPALLLMGVLLTAREGLIPPLNPSKGGSPPCAAG